MPAQFNVDPAVIEAAAKAMGTLKSQTAGARADADALMHQLNLYAKLKDAISKSTIVNPKEKRALVELGKELRKAGVTKQAMQSATSKELTNYKSLSVIDKIRVRMLQSQAAAQEKQTKSVVYNGKILELQNNLLKKSTQVAGNIASKFKNVAESTTGVEFSLTGVLRLLFEIHNQDRRIGAMAMQTAAQWGTIGKHTEKAVVITNVLMRDFRMTADAAGELLRNVAQSGLEYKNALSVVKDMAAIEKVYGVSVQDSTDFVNTMAKNYGMASTEAMKLERVIIDSTKLIPGLAPEQALADMKEMSNLSRAYNVNLLDTLSMYNLLIRKDLAKKLGLGDAPREVQQSILKTVAGFNQELDDGWKAALGDGATAASKILNFEKLAQPEQFVRMATMLREKTAGFVGDEREYAVRQLLKQFGFTAAEVNKTLAKAFTSGGFDAEGLSDAMKTLGEEKTKLEAAVGNDKQYQAEVLSNARRIADGLQTWGDRMSMQIRDSLKNDPKWKSLSTMLEKLQKDVLDQVPNAIKLVTTIGKVLETMLALLTDIHAWIAEDHEEKRTRKGTDMENAQANAPERANLMTKLQQRGMSPTEAVGGMHFMQNTLDTTDSPGAWTTLYNKLSKAGFKFQGQTQGATNRIFVNELLKHVSEQESITLKDGRTMNEMEALIEAIVTKNHKMFQEVMRQQLKEATSKAKQETGASGNTTVTTAPKT